MNITVENLAPCKKLLRVEVDAKAVDETFEAITKDFQKQAALPGFRPGKAPRAMVLKKYEPDIKAEVKRKLIGDSYRQAVAGEKNLRHRLSGHRGNPVRPRPDAAIRRHHRNRAGISTAGIQGICRPNARQKSVTAADVDRAIELLAKQHIQFETVARELRAGDVAVVNYTGTCDGKPITDTAPTAKGLTEQKNFWVDTTPDAFIPGFADQLIGAKAGDKRTVNVDFPADFVTKQLAGKKGVYEVEVVEVKEKSLPAAG